MVFLLKNKFLFVDRLDGFEYLNNVLCNHIFDIVFVEFMGIVQDGDNYFNISEEMMQVIESVDPLYEHLLAYNKPIQVHKPALVKKLLDTLEGRYSDYLSMSKEEQLRYIFALFRHVD